MRTDIPIFLKHHVLFRIAVMDKVQKPDFEAITNLTLRLLMSYTYGAPSKARNANVVYIWTYVWQR